MFKGIGFADTLFDEGLFKHASRFHMEPGSILRTYHSIIYLVV